MAWFFSAQWTTFTPPLTDLHAQYPKYLPDPLALYGHSWGGEDFIDYAWLNVTKEDFDEFGGAMHDFWMAMPERLFYKFPDE